MNEPLTSQYGLPVFPTLEPPPGNERVARSLSKAFEIGKVHHAYLFEGPQGVGKSQMATWFCALLFCEGELLRPNEPVNGASFLPCGDCASCHLLQKGEHPDYEQTAPEEGRSKIVIDQIRSVVKHSSFRPLKSERRVFELRSADKMDAVPANALLKTLEEPASYNVFILLTDRAHALLDTILSRCQNVRFASLDAQVITQMLESEDVSAKEARILGAASSGSITAARQLHEIGFLELAEEWLERYLDPLATRTPTADVVVDEVAQLSTAHRRSPDAQYGEIALLFRCLKLGLRDAVLVGQGMGADTLTWPDRMKNSEALYDGLGSEAILSLMERLAKAHELFERPLNTTLILEDLLLRVLSARKRASRKAA